MIKGWSEAAVKREEGPLEIFCVQEEAPEEQGKRSARAQETARRQGDNEKRTYGGEVLHEGARRDSGESAGVDALLNERVNLLVLEREWRAGERRLPVDEGLQTGSRAG